MADTTQEKLFITLMIAPVQVGTILEASRAVLIFKSSNLIIAMHHSQYIILHY